MNRTIPVIDPSEVVIDRRGNIKEESFSPNPWLRFLARFFDYSLWLAILGVMRWIVGWKSGAHSLIPVEFLLFIPIEALFLKFWGKTIGKHFLKIGLKQGKRQKLSFPFAFKRSLQVWFRGVGMMIPIFNAFCMIVSYYRLKNFGQTTWDKDDGIQVYNKPIGKWRIVFASLFSFLIFYLYYHQ